MTFSTRQLDLTYAAWLQIKSKGVRRPMPDGSFKFFVSENLAVHRAQRAGRGSPRLSYYVVILIRFLKHFEGVATRATTMTRATKRPRTKQSKKEQKRHPPPSASVEEEASRERGNTTAAW